MKKNILLILFVIVGLFTITGCGNNGSSKKAQVYELDASFEHNGIKVTLGNDYKKESWVHGVAIRIPVTFENVSNETKELGISLDFFAPDGGEVSGINGGLKNSHSSTKIKSGGKLEDEIYFVAEKEGSYTIEIQNSKISIHVNIS